MRGFSPHIVRHLLIASVHQSTHGRSPSLPGADKRLVANDRFLYSDQMLISLSKLAAIGKIQTNILSKVRPVGLISINTKD